MVKLCLTELFGSTVGKIRKIIALLHPVKTSLFPSANGAKYEICVNIFFKPPVPELARNRHLFRSVLRLFFQSYADWKGYERVPSSKKNHKLKKNPTSLRAAPMICKKHAISRPQPRVIWAETINP